MSKFLTKTIKFLLFPGMFLIAGTAGAAPCDSENSLYDSITWEKGINFTKISMTLDQSKLFEGDSGIRDVIRNKDLKSIEIIGALQKRGPGIVRVFSSDKVEPGLKDETNFLLVTYNQYTGNGNFYAFKSSESELEVVQEYARISPCALDFLHVNDGKKKINVFERFAHDDKKNYQFINMNLAAVVVLAGQIAEYLEQTKVVFYIPEIRLVRYKYLENQEADGEKIAHNLGLNVHPVFYIGTPYYRQLQQNRRPKNLPNRYLGWGAYLVFNESFGRDKLKDSLIFSNMYVKRVSDGLLANEHYNSPQYVGWSNFDTEKAQYKLPRGTVNNNIVFTSPAELVDSWSSGNLGLSVTATAAFLMMRDDASYLDNYFNVPGNAAFSFCSKTTDSRYCQKKSLENIRNGFMMVSSHDTFKRAVTEGMYNSQDLTYEKYRTNGMFYDNDKKHVTYKPPLGLLTLYLKENYRNKPIEQENLLDIKLRPTVLNNITVTDKVANGPVLKKNANGKVVINKDIIAPLRAILFGKDITAQYRLNDSIYLTNVNASPPRVGQYQTGELSVFYRAVATNEQAVIDERDNCNQEVLSTHGYYSVQYYRCLTSLEETKQELKTAIQALNEKGRRLARGGDYVEYRTSTNINTSPLITMHLDKHYTSRAEWGYEATQDLDEIRKKLIDDKKLYDHIKSKFQKFRGRGSVIIKKCYHHPHGLESEIDKHKCKTVTIFSNNREQTKLEKYSDDEVFVENIFDFNPENLNMVEEWRQ